MKAFGTPPVVATRYSPEPALIHGGLMVAYRRVLVMACFAVLAIQCAILLSALMIAERGTHGILITTAGGRALFGLMMAFTCVTIAFAALSRLYVERGRPKA